jgi:hypothetical protein
VSSGVRFPMKRWGVAAMREGGGIDGGGGMSWQS